MSIETDLYNQSFARGLDYALTAEPDESLYEPTITEDMMLGTSTFQGDDTVNLHTIPNGAKSIILGYSLLTPKGYACYGIRGAQHERVRLGPAYVETLEAANAVIRDDAFAHAHNPERANADMASRKFRAPWDSKAMCKVCYRTLDAHAPGLWGVCDACIADPGLSSNDFDDEDF
jgi:hypothetical protein